MHQTNIGPVFSVIFRMTEPTTFYVLKSAADGVVAEHRRPRQRVDLVFVSAEAVRHLAFLAHVDQHDHPVFVPETERPRLHHKPQQRGLVFITTHDT